METEVIKPSKIFYFVSFGIFLLGIVLFVVILVKGIYSSVAGIDKQVIVPGTSVIELKETGKYIIYSEYRSVIDGKVFETDNINGLMCSLKKIDTGEFIELEEPSMNSTYSVGGREGKSIFGFNINETGKYELKAWYETDNYKESVLAIGKGFGKELIRTILLSIAIMFISLGTSITIFVTTLIKRRRAKLIY